MVSGAVAQGHEDSPPSLRPAPYPVPKYVSFLSLWALSVLAKQIRDVVRHPFLPVSCGKEGGAAPPRGPSRRYPPATPVSLALDVTLVCPQHLVSSKAGSIEFQSSGPSFRCLQTQRYCMQTTAGGLLSSRVRTPSAGLVGSPDRTSSRALQPQLT